MTTPDSTPIKQEALDSPQPADPTIQDASQTTSTTNTVLAPTAQSPPAPIQNSPVQAPVPQPVTDNRTVPTERTFKFADQTVTLKIDKIWPTDGGYNRIVEVPAGTVFLTEHGIDTAGIPTGGHYNDAGQSVLFNMALDPKKPGFPMGKLNSKPAKKGEEKPAREFPQFDNNGSPKMGNRASGNPAIIRDEQGVDWYVHCDGRMMVGRWCDMTFWNHKHPNTDHDSKLKTGWPRMGAVLFPRVTPNAYPRESDQWQPLNPKLTSWAFLHGVANRQYKGEKRGRRHRKGQEGSSGNDGGSSTGGEGSATTTPTNKKLKPIEADNGGGETPDRTTAADAEADAAIEAEDEEEETEEERKQRHAKRSARLAKWESNWQAGRTRRSSLLAPANSRPAFQQAYAPLSSLLRPGLGAPPVVFAAEQAPPEQAPADLTTVLPAASSVTATEQALPDPATSLPASSAVAATGQAEPTTNEGLVVSLFDHIVGKVEEGDEFAKVLERHGWARK